MLKQAFLFQYKIRCKKNFRVLVTFSLLDEDGNIKESKEIYIDVNKTIPNDLRNLWIAMSLFWVGIGGYMIYMYQKNIKINASRFITPEILCVIESRDEICHL